MNPKPCTLHQAFIDEEQFLKTHYYTASKRLFMASMMSTPPNPNSQTLNEFRAAQP